MPNYDYHCLTCQRVYEEQRLIAKRDDVHPCPFCDGLDIERQIAAPGVSYTINDRKHIPETFKDVLRNIKSKHRHSTIDV